MQFTVVFDMKYNLGDGSFSIRYHPATVWMQGDKVLPLNIENSPKYELGGLKALLEFAELNDQTLNSNKVVVVMSDTGYGTTECLQNICQDLRNENFEPTIAP
jgi:hypothetical protein